jgi:hypothetical protein
MRKIFCLETIMIFSSISILSGCSINQLFGPTPTSTSSSTITPAFTPSLTNTPTDTITPTITFTVSVTNNPPVTEPRITNTPISAWEHIPVMKGAYNIEVGIGSINFSIKDTIIIVYTYYVKAMKNLGYKISADSEGGKGKMTFYEKDGVMITIAIVTDPNEDGVTQVMIIK